MTRRIKLKGRKVGYHAITRTVHREFLLNDHMKKFFIQTLLQLNRLYYCEIGGFCCMSNHTHLLIRFFRPDEVDPDSALYRWNEFHRDKYGLNRSVQENREYVVECLTDISHFMKKLNTLMTREYNRMSGHTGTMWGRRFRSSLVERGSAMVMTGAYIELNSFRASLVARPEEYKYSSLYWLQKGNSGDLIATDILDETFHVDVNMGISDKVKRNISKPRNKKVRKEYVTALYEKYLKYIYKQGTKPPERKLIRGKTDSIRITEQMQEQLDEKVGIGESEDEEDTGIELQKGVGLCKRIWTFTGGKFIGSRRFAQTFYGDHVDPGYERTSSIKKHEKKWMHGMAGGLWGVFNGSRRGREERKRSDASGSDGKDKNGRWIEGGQRGSPPT